MGDLAEQLERYQIEAAEARARAEHLATQLERQREELAEARDEARAANRLKSEFVANVSHELRTPLNGILGMTALALETQLSRQQAEYLQLISSSANSLLTIVNDILDFSKIETGSLELEQIEFDLRETVADTLRPLSTLATDKALELVCEIEPYVPRYVVGDPSRLRKILVNLIHNAIKFTEAGEVVLHVRVQRAGPKETALRFEVADTGIGIPAERQRWIFQSFAQIDGSSTRKRGGTGLGLAISAQLATLMGGEIQVNSEPGNGSTFTLLASFPVVEHRGDVHRMASSESLRGLRVLVADDNNTCRRVLSGSLTQGGLEPTAVADGQAAWDELIRAHDAGNPYAVAVLDAHMPELDGFELASRLLGDERLRDTAVILLTLAGHRGDAARCREIGVAAYHTKPLLPADLIDAIRAVKGAELDGGTPPTLITRHSLREGRAGIETEQPLAESSNGASVVDETSLIDRLSGDSALLEEIAQMFGSERREVLERLAAAIRSRDGEELERGSLKLGSTLSNLAADPVARVAQRLAGMELDGDLAEVERVFHDLESKVAQVEQELMALARSRSSDHDPAVETTMIDPSGVAPRTGDGERR